MTQSQLLRRRHRNPQSLKQRPWVWGLGALGFSLALLVGCDDKPAEQTPDSKPSAAPTSAASGTTPTASINGNAEHGKALMKEFECNRCHDGTGHEPMALEKHCIHCHQDIVSGKFNAPATSLAKWKPNVEHYLDAPSFEGSNKRYRAEWLVSFLSEPHDLRPGLVQSMPRLKLEKQQVADIAAYLTQGAKRDAGKDPLADANLEKGRKLIEEKGCGSCHVMSGVPAFMTKPDPKAADENTRRGQALAPDLRWARDKFPVESLIAWIKDPKSIKPDTRMPVTSLTNDEARDIAAYVFKAELTPFEAKPIPERLPKLTRAVTYQEVFDKVFGKTCTHCHSNPDVARGDGGPGNTGGFGFKPRGLNMGSYSSLMSGMLDDQGERMSIFTPMKDGTPRVVAALLARQAEEAGKPNPEIRGMPLSLPALKPEEIQLVETWIAQGRPRE
ncbi:MAG: cytochrome c [Polyangiaceae bacterium]